MRRTLQALKSLERHLAHVEAQAAGAGELTGKQQLAILQDALYGDSAAEQRLHELHQAGRIHPFLYRLFMLETTGPCRGEGCTTCLTHRPEVPDPPKESQRIPGKEQRQ